MEARARAQLGQGVAFGVSQARVGSAVQAAAQHPAAQASETEARRLLGSKEQQLDGTLWWESALPQSTDRLQASQHAHCAVKLSRVGNGVDMRAGADCSKLRPGTSPAGKHIAHRIFAH